MHAYISSLTNVGHMSKHANIGIHQSKMDRSANVFICGMTLLSGQIETSYITLQVIQVDM